MPPRRRGPTGTDGKLYPLCARFAAAIFSAIMHNAIAVRAERYRRFYESNRPGDVLIVVRQNPYWVSKKNLCEYDFEAGGHLAMAEDMARCAETLLEKSEQVGDDLIPWMSADFGIAIHHAWVVEVPVQFAEWTSWAEHPLAGSTGYERLNEIVYDRRNRWVQRMFEMVNYWRERAHRPYLIAGHYHFSPLDLANALRGDELFTDFYDVPDEVRALLDRCTEVTIGLEREFRIAIGPQPGLPFWGALAPPGSVFVSEDAMDMIGPHLAERWGRPWTERLRDALGGLAVHHHMLGLPVHGIIGRMARRSLVQISNDPNCPPAADRLLELAEASGDNALMFDCSLEQLRRIQPVLSRLRAVVVVAVGDDQAAGREAVALVRSVSNIQ